MQKTQGNINKLEITDLQNILTTDIYATFTKTQKEKTRTITTL